MRLLDGDERIIEAINKGELGSLRQASNEISSAEMGQMQGAVS
jgi:hypothetical protein